MQYENIIYKKKKTRHNLRAQGIFITFVCPAIQKPNKKSKQMIHWETKMSKYLPCDSFK